MVQRLAESFSMDNTLIVSTFETGYELEFLVHKILSLIFGKFKA
jgi:hypothetical protein